MSAEFFDRQISMLIDQQYPAYGRHFREQIQPLMTQTTAKVATMVDSIVSNFD